MKRVIILGLISLSFTCFGQRKIVGRILDSENLKPIKNVQVKIPESKVESFTNHLGFFELDIDQSIKRLIVNHISYGTSEINVPEQDKFMIKLTTQPFDLPDIDTRSSSKYSTYTIHSDSLRIESRYSTNLSTVAEFKGGMDSLFQYVGTKLTIDESIEDKFICNADVAFIANVLFTATKEGSTSNITVSGDTLYGMGNKIVNIFNSMKWKPASQKSEACDQVFKIKIYYGRFVFAVVDNPPSFLGSQIRGDLTSFYKYVDKNLIYPKKAKQNRINGSVFVSFIINRKGEIVQELVKVIKGLGYGLDEEAIRIVKDSPKWNPASQRENFVYYRMVIPIKFQF